MGQVLVDSDSLTAIGDAIRKKTNQVIKYKPAEMPAAINNINSLKLGGYKVNITQSDHQTIHVVQSTFSDQESGFTIEDHPTINISLTADPGYIAGSLNLTNFTFSNDVREVDIFATAATQSPNITYNGNMNVFLAQSIGDMFNITTGTKDDSMVQFDEYTDNEAFALTLENNGEQSWERISINYKDNFYNLDPNANYKITALKIGDTSLSDTDLSDNYGGLNISSTDTNVVIYADISKTWVKSVYKQCTGKELNNFEINSEDDVSAEKVDALMQSESNGYLGQQIADRLYDSGFASNPIVNDVIQSFSSEFFTTLSKDKQTEFINSIEFFMTSYETNTTGFRDGNLVQNYFNVLKQLQDQYANDTTATTILEKYNPLKNIEYILNSSVDVFEIIYKIDPSNTYRFTSSLNGGLAYVLWIFYVYRIVFILADSGFTPADPIISTIPVSITFTNVTQ